MSIKSNPGSMDGEKSANDTPDNEENELLNWWRYLDQDDDYIDEVTQDDRQD